MYENRTVEEVCREFSVDLRTGLSAAEVEVRQRHYGENELREAPPRSLIVRIGAQLCDSLIFVLFAAAGISLLLGEYGDAGVILAVVVLNATVGVIQEGKAEKALESLKRMTQLEAVVIREGKEREIAARELVPGDLVVLDAGRQVPADLRLTETAEMRAEESALTGESRAVEKNSHFLAAGALPVAERKNETFMTSYVTAGRGKGIVIATGMNTEVGRIASLIRRRREGGDTVAKAVGSGKLLSILTIGLYLYYCPRRLAEARRDGNAAYRDFPGGSCRAGGASDDGDDCAGAGSDENGAGWHDRAPSSVRGNTGGSQRGLLR